MQRYVEATGNPDAIRTLLAEHARQHA
jgi:hypothetical protein